MAQSPLNDTTQPVDSEEEGRSSTMDRRWLIEKKNKKKIKNVKIQTWEGVEMCPWFFWLNVVVTSLVKPQSYPPVAEHNFMSKAIKSGQGKHGDSGICPWQDPLDH